MPEGHPVVGDARLHELRGVGVPAEAVVEGHGGELGVAEDLAKPEFAEGTGFELDDEPAADALALALEVDSHLRELAGAPLGVVGDQEDAADDALAEGVVEDGDEMLGPAVDLGVVGVEPGDVLAEGAQQDRLAQGALLRVEGVGGCDLPVADHGWVSGSGHYRSR